MPLFTTAGLLWSHTSYNHSSEGVCTPTLRHRGKNQPRLHLHFRVPPSHPKPTTLLDPPSRFYKRKFSDSAAVVSKVSPVHCGPLFSWICFEGSWLINESSGSAVLSPVHPIYPPYPTPPFLTSIYSLPESICFVPLVAVTTSVSPAGFSLQRLRARLLLRALLVVPNIKRNEKKEESRRHRVTRRPGGDSQRHLRTLKKNQHQQSPLLIFFFFTRNI